MGRNHSFPGRTAFLLIAMLLMSRSVRGDELTALDRYVAAPDPTFSYKLVSTIPGQGYRAFVLEMVSQTWLTAREVNQPVWKHWLVVVRPDTVNTTKAMLLIGGGSNDKAAPKRASAILTAAATSAKSVAAELMMVPNQPLIFADEGKPRVEDAMIAYTWDKYLKGGDEQWPARLPMTKSVVRAMDAVTAFCRSGEGGGVKIESFVVAGASKRGWTTWTTAAVDKRVAAIMPIVIDTLNVHASAAHHYRAYGFWAPALQDYVRMNVEEWMNTPEFKALMRIEDPYEYRQRLTMPKYIINAAGDEFFLPDNSQFYFDDLPGTKYLRYVPNADHSLKNSDASQTAVAFYQAIVAGSPLPQFSWTLEQDGSIRVKTQDRPAEVKIWQATNPKARDFRLMTIGPAWQSSAVKEQANGVYAATVEKPVSGWTAFFMELTYPNGGTAPLKFTTPVRIVPDVLPHELPKKAAASARAA